MGYPLYVKKSDTLRDGPLLEFAKKLNSELSARVSFISGTKDSMGPKEKVNKVYEEMKGILIGKEKRLIELNWVEGGSHGLKVGKRNKIGQKETEKNILKIIKTFCEF